VRSLGLAILLSVLALWWLTLEGQVRRHDSLDDSPDAKESLQVSQRSCALAEIRMSNDGGGIDAKLQPIQAKLRKPPFSGFDSFVQISATLPGEPLALSSGENFQFLLSEVSGHRLTFKVQAENADGKEIAKLTIRMDVGESYLIGLNSKDDYGTVVWLDCSGTRV
jgi:hypothetical protein